jgi:hypothetical protein
LDDLSLPFHQGGTLDRLQLFATGRFGQKDPLGRVWGTSSFKLRAGLLSCLDYFFGRYERLGTIQAALKNAPILGYAGSAILSAIN